MALTHYTLYSTETIESKRVDLSLHEIKAQCARLFFTGSRKGLDIVVKGPECRPSGTLVTVGFRKDDESPARLRGFVKAGRTTRLTGSYSKISDVWPRLWKIAEKALSMYNFHIRKSVIIKKINALDRANPLLAQVEALFSTRYILASGHLLAPDDPAVNSELDEEQIRKLCSNLFSAGDYRRSWTALYLAISRSGCPDIYISLGYEEACSGTLRGYVTFPTDVSEETVQTDEYTGTSFEAWQDLWKTFRRIVKSCIEKKGNTELQNQCS